MQKMSSFSLTLSCIGKNKLFFHKVFLHGQYCSMHYRSSIVNKPSSVHRPITHRLISDFRSVLLHITEKNTVTLAGLIIAVSPKCQYSLVAISSTTVGLSHGRSATSVYVYQYCTVVVLYLVLSTRWRKSRK